MGAGARQWGRAEGGRHGERRGSGGVSFAAAWLPSEAPHQWDQFGSQAGGPRPFWSGPVLQAGFRSTPSTCSPLTEAARTEPQAGLGEKSQQSDADS